MSADEYIVIYCIEVRQPIGRFYVGSIASDDLAAISYADIRRIQQGLPRDVEEFSGIQRPLSEKRVEELRQYVSTIDAAFPTSIILHIPSEFAEFDSKGVMRIARKPNVAKIIDGQHRIAGLHQYKGQQFELNVTVFVDMDMEDQALLFATINLKQTKVNKSLAFDLYEFATARSPQKTCHNIARLLNSKKDSPFFHKIKILGTASADRDETLTQAAFVDRLLPLISDDPMRDRDALKRGHSLPIPPVSAARQLVFRNLFRDDHDAEIARNTWNFFDAVRNKWSGAWDNVERGIILNRTTGFSALMRLLPVAYRRLAPNLSQVVPESRYAGLLAPIRLKDDDFNRERYLPGTSGQAGLFRDLLADTGLGGPT